MRKNILMLTLFSLIFSFGYSQCLTTLSSGDYFNYGLKSNGTLWTWGSGGFGQMGNGSDADRRIPTQLGTATNWQAIACGSYYSFALKTNGTLWCTGDNSLGQLGIGSTAVYINTLTQMGTATNWKQVSGGSSQTYAIKTDGTLWGWGQNDGYQMGDGTCCANRLSPGQIGTATNWKFVGSSGSDCGVAIKTDGTLWGWGYNLSGILGPSNLSTRAFPTQLNSATDWATIAVGGAHILALKTNGTLWAWGAGGNGRCGDTLPEAYFRDTPVQIGNSTWTSIVATYQSSYGIKSDGTLWAWGKNDTGQLGDGSTTDRFQPVQIGTDTDWASIGGGWFHAVAIKTNGALYGWGSNDYGQLGNNTTVATVAPIPVAVVGCTLDTEQFAANSLVLSPNPATNELYLSYEGALISGVRIYDLLGRVVYRDNPMATTTLQAVLPLTDLAAGTYILTLEAAGVMVASKRFVKE